MKIYLTSFFSIALASVSLTAASSSTSSDDNLCEECPNGSYFLFVEKTGEGPYGIAQAIEDTPPDCALAPIRTEGDVLAASAAVTTGFAYVGSYRPTDTYFEDCGNDLSCTEFNTGWLNYDGTEVPDDPLVWETAVGPGFRLHLAVGNGGTTLFDAIPADDTMAGAVYKCCLPIESVCSLENPSVMTE